MVAFSVAAVDPRRCRRALPRPAPAPHSTPPRPAEPRPARPARPVPSRLAAVTYFSRYRHLAPTLPPATAPHTPAHTPRPAPLRPALYFVAAPGCFLANSACSPPERAPHPRRPVCQSTMHARSTHQPRLQLREFFRKHQRPHVRCSLSKARRQRCTASSRCRSNASWPPRNTNSIIVLSTSTPRSHSALTYLTRQLPPCTQPCHALRPLTPPQPPCCWYLNTSINI